jgi:hypothetical protein
MVADDGSTWGMWAFLRESGFGLSDGQILHRDPPGDRVQTCRSTEIRAGRKCRSDWTVQWQSANSPLIVELQAKFGSQYPT